MFSIVLHLDLKKYVNNIEAQRLEVESWKYDYTYDDTESANQKLKLLNESLEIKSKLHPKGISLEMKNLLSERAHVYIILKNYGMALNDFQKVFLEYDKSLPDRLAFISGKYNQILYMNDDASFFRYLHDYYHCLNIFQLYDEVVFVLERADERKSRTRPDVDGDWNLIRILLSQAYFKIGKYKEGLHFMSLATKFHGPEPRDLGLYGSKFLEVYSKRPLYLNIAYVKYYEALSIIKRGNYWLPNSIQVKIDYYQKALGIFENTEFPHLPSDDLDINMLKKEVERLFCIGTCYYKLGDWVLALSNVESGLTKCIYRLNNSSEYAYAMRILMDLMIFKLNFKKFRDWFDWQSPN